MKNVYVIFYVRVNLAGAHSTPELVAIYQTLVDAEKHKDQINTALQRNCITWEYVYITSWEVK